LTEAKATGVTHQLLRELAGALVKQVGDDGGSLQLAIH
jgi:hypothetical protein